MSPVTPDGAAAPHLPAEAEPSAAGPKRQRRFPWREIARRLAAGGQPAEVAVQFALDEDRIWRHLRRSARFRFYLQQAVDRQRLLSGLQLAATAGGALVMRGRQAESLDADGLRLLSEAGGSESPPEGGIGRQVARLGETAGLPPNMAWRSRMAAQRREMDLEAAEARGFSDGLQSGLAHAAAARTAAQVRLSARPEPGPNRPDTAPNEPRSTSNGPDTSSNGPDSTPNGPETASNGPRTAPRRAGGPPGIVPPPVVDLEGPDLARLRALGLLGSPET
jgi:hypothetical protein